MFCFGVMHLLSKLSFTVLYWILWNLICSVHSFNAKLQAWEITVECMRELLVLLHYIRYFRQASNGMSTCNFCRKWIQPRYLFLSDNISSMFAHNELLLSATASLLLLARDSGSVYLSTSGLPRHSQHLVRNWEHIYFDNHFQTLVFNCFAIWSLKLLLLRQL